MFTYEELLNKEKAFELSKQRFEAMDDFFNEKTLKFRDEYTNYSFIFITIARFITYKEDIWIKNKKTKTIATNFSKEILDNFLFNGKFTSTKLGFKEGKKNKYTITPITINTILKGKENDSIWIIDTIRDSIAHGHYYIDFDNSYIVVKNNHEDRLLDCRIKFDQFAIMNELITEERIGGYTNKKLTTPPILSAFNLTNRPPITNIKDKNMLRELFKTDFIVSYCQVTKNNEQDPQKRYKDLTNFYNFHTRLMKDLNNKYDKKLNVNLSKYYVEKIKNYCKDNMNNYDITIHSKDLDNDIVEKVILYLEEQPKFYERNIEEQGLILQEILKSLLSHEEITLERGVTDLCELYSSCALREYTNKEDLEELNNLIFSNVNSFRQNKKLANLFILATTNFVSNKESIYDKYFNDYTEFDISSFNFQDYSGYNKIFKSLKNANTKLFNLNNKLNNLLIKKNNLQNNLSLSPINKKSLIQNNINNLNILINDTANEINNLVLEVTDLSNQLSNTKTDPNGNYIDNNNVSFFTHLRNAFAHNHVSYLEDKLVYNRKILLEDYNDDGTLTFTCTCRYYDLVKLFNNDLFKEAIINKKQKENYLNLL